MPTHLIDPAARTVFTIMEERLNAKALQQLFDAVKADVRFRPQFDHMIDFRATRDVSVSFTSAMRIAELCPFWPQSRWAWVTSDDLQRSLANMLMAMMALEHEVEYFSDVHCAHRWLLAPMSLRVSQLRPADTRESSSVA